MGRPHHLWGNRLITGAKVVFSLRQGFPNRLQNAVAWITSVDINQIGSDISLKTVLLSMT